jgi:hypothetical protein
MFSYFAVWVIIFQIAKSQTNVTFKSKKTNQRRNTQIFVDEKRIKMGNTESLTTIKKGAKDTERGRLNNITRRILKASIRKLLMKLLEKNNNKMKQITLEKYLVENTSRSSNMAAPIRFPQRSHKHKMSVLESLIPAPRPTKFIPIIQPIRHNYSALESDLLHSMKKPAQDMSPEAVDIRHLNIRDKEKQRTDILSKFYRDVENVNRQLQTILLQDDVS